MRTLVFFLGLAAMGLGQERFEVASIKPTAPDVRGTSIQFQPPLGLRISNCTLRMMITFAYDIRDFQLVGGPGWVGSERFDVLAKSEKKAGSEEVPDDPRKMTEAQLKTRADEIRERLRNLLADRFGLKVHRESKEGAVYALLVAKGGVKIQPVTEDRTKRQGISSSGRGQMTAYQLPISMFVNFLSGELNRPVLDQTELTGKYDFNLVWTPELGERREPGEPPPATQADGPSVFTALREVLGLRLEAQRGPVPMVVIDQVEHPSEKQ
jgi:uncharacterized protein (TIGR03435 family)